MREYERGLNITAPYTGDLEPKFVDWALAKYRHDKFGEEMSKQHKNMSKTWLEILVTGETCAKATEARTYPKRRAQQKLVVAKLRANRMQSSIEVSERIGDAIQGKMQERDDLP